MRQLTALAQAKLAYVREFWIFVHASIAGLSPVYYSRRTDPHYPPIFYGVTIATSSSVSSISWKIVVRKHRGLSFLMSWRRVRATYCLGRWTAILSAQQRDGNVLGKSSLGRPPFIPI